MAKFKKILVPLDGSANANRGLDRALEIAKESDAEITGLRIFLPATRNSPGSTKCW